MPLRATPARTCDPTYQTLWKNAVADCMPEHFKEFRFLRSLQRGPRFSQVMPFLLELSPRESWKWKRTVRRSLLLCGEPALSQTGRALQPLARHFRYYSEGLRLASDTSV